MPDSPLGQSVASRVVELGKGTPGPASYDGMTPGQHLYCRLCGSTVSDAARYWTLMNRAVKEDWERLAREIDGQVSRLQTLLEAREAECARWARRWAEAGLGECAYVLAEEEPHA